MNESKTPERLEIRRETRPRSRRAPRVEWSQWWSNFNRLADVDFYLKPNTQQVTSMVALLPPELLQTVARQHPCRNSQIEQLATLYSVS